MEINAVKLFSEVLAKCGIKGFNPITNIEELENFISKLQEKKEELECFKHRAPKGGKYYTVDLARSGCFVIETKEDYHELDNDRYECGNYFLIEEEAEKQAERMNFDMRARKWMRENT